MPMLTNGFVRMSYFFWGAVFFLSSSVYSENNEGPFNHSGLNSSFRMFYSLVFVLVLFYGCVYIYKRFFMKELHVWKGKEKLIENVHTHYLAPKRSLMVVRVGKEHLVLGVSDESINLITKMETVESVRGEKTKLELVKKSGSQKNGVYAIPRQADRNLNENNGSLNIR